MPSFDIVSKTDMAEMDNAVAGVAREITQRFDFKGSRCTIERQDQVITILADDETRLRQMQELLSVYATRRGLDIKALEYQTPERAAGDSLRQKVLIKQGIDKDIAKRLIKEIKDSKIKVQATIQGDELRVTGKKRDELQSIIALAKKLDLPLPLQYVNFRD